jgi:hypothetical protein
LGERDYFVAVRPSDLADRAVEARSRRRPSSVAAHFGNERFGRADLLEQRLVLLQSA